MIKGMMGTLDPFSQYMDEQETNDMKDETNGAFGGLGIEIAVKNRLLTVVSPIEDTPCRTRLGIRGKSTNILKTQRRAPTDSLGAHGRGAQAAR